MTLKQVTSSKMNLASTSSMFVICMTIAFCHLSLSLHAIEPTVFYSFGARQPFLYRVLIPAVFSLLPINYSLCKTGLKFPVSNCADLTALCLDWLALVFACVALISSFRILSSNERTPFHRPELIVPVFLWMVIFDYMLVPNWSAYYPYDFLQLFFFSVAVWIGASRRGGFWAMPLLTFLSALNKEDAVFLPLVGALYASSAGKFDRKVIVATFVSFLLVVAAKYVSIAYVNSIVESLSPARPELFELHLFDNLRQALNPVAWLSWLSMFGGSLFFLPMLSPRYRYIRFAVIALLLSWITIMFIVGMMRQLRLMGPMIFPMVLPMMLIIDTYLYGNRDSRS
jgi:hypothetical protein